MKLYTVEQFLNTTKILGGSISADDRSILFSSNKTGIFNAFELPADGGAARQLTHSTTDNTFAVSYFPNDRRILFSRDRGGNEQHHLFVLEADGVEKDLTPGVDFQAEFLVWSHDDESFYFQTNERDGRFFDIYRMDITTFQRMQVYQDNDGYQFG